MQVGSEKGETLLRDVALLRGKYDSLHLRLRGGGPSLVGELRFTAVCGGHELADRYELDVRIPDDYPLRPPATKEVGGRIPRNVDSHVSPDGTLCLGPPLEVLRKFKEDPTLLGYTENLLIPTLYWHSYKQTHPEEPLRGYLHGDEGIRQYREEVDLLEVYCAIFHVKQLKVVLRFLELLCKDACRDDMLCPCGSGVTLSHCHGETLKSLLRMPYLKTTHLAQDYWYLRDAAKRDRKRG